MAGSGLIPSDNNTAHDGKQQANAAVKIQRAWRSRQHGAQDQYLTKEARWDDLLTNVRFEVGVHTFVNFVYIL
jgi:hypothetical protein